MEIQNFPKNYGKKIDAPEKKSKIYSRFFSKFCPQAKSYFRFFLAKFCFFGQGMNGAWICDRRASTAASERSVRSERATRPARALRRALRDASDSNSSPRSRAEPIRGAPSRAVPKRSRVSSGPLGRDLKALCRALSGTRATTSAAGLCFSFSCCNTSKGKILKARDGGQNFETKIFRKLWKIMGAKFSTNYEKLCRAKFSTNYEKFWESSGA